MAGQPITLTLPAVGDAFPAAAAQVTAAITALEVELERKVVPADMSMSADLSFLVSAVNYRVKDLLASSYVLNASALSAVTYPRSTYFTGADGDFYINDGAGRQVRITSGGVVNTAASGNITSTGSPAYGTSSVELRWDGADLEFEMRAGAGADDYADVRLDDVVFNDGSGNFLRVTAQAMASDYTVTFPAATPASTSVVQMSSAGTLTASPSGSIATTGTVATGALTVTGAATVSGLTTIDDSLVVNLSLEVAELAEFLDSVDIGNTLTVGVGGIENDGDYTAAANQDVILSGTGVYKHGARTLNIASRSFAPDDDGTSAAFFAGGAAPHAVKPLWRCSNVSGACFFTAPLNLPVGTRITDTVLHYYGGGTAGTRAVSIKSVRNSDADTNVVSTNTGTSTTGDNSVTATTDVTITTGFSYALVVSLIAGATLDSTVDFLKSVVLTYDQP
jgi:hypothetical protein